MFFLCSWNFIYYWRDLLTNTIPHKSIFRVNIFKKEGKFDAKPYLKVHIALILCCLAFTKHLNEITASCNLNDTPLARNQSNIRCDKGLVFLYGIMKIPDSSDRFLLFHISKFDSYKFCFFLSELAYFWRSCI